ncbi:hypothetical protein Phi46:3_gp106 [Cellulophaga phage phi46:3]|uniref:Uncharacterized protein n=1 Tax=Cellulophaga phage phi46:3 TaxID=1327985 RepID=S0A221_9CAUD|nr:hypothetical protein Phi46:3_gp106 [Cellulophaga phage phi46:3]AGO48850.1 hypothetical protein Phi46:3_gp106 [Cellulophaga phage phi46:3]
MESRRYDVFLSKSKNNILKNKSIIKGAVVEYFNYNKKTVTITEVNFDKCIVRYKDEKGYTWYDYFMDANCFVI